MTLQGRMVGGEFDVKKHSCECYVNVRFMLGLGGVPSVVMFIGLIFMPESPRWLVFHNRADKAREVLAKTRQPEEIEEELQNIKEEHQRLKKEKMSMLYMCNTNTLHLVNKQLSLPMPHLIQYT